MPLTVDFKPLANAVGANVETQAAYETDLGSGGALQHGYQSGIVPSAQLNKTLRQSSVMTAALANFISQTQNIDVLDDGDVPALVLNLINALRTNQFNASSFLSATAAPAYSQAIAPTTATKIICADVVVDTLNEYNSVTGVFTPTIAGYYQFFGRVLGSTVNVNVIANIAIPNGRWVRIYKSSDNTELTKMYADNPVVNTVAIGGVTPPIHLDAGEGVYMAYRTDVGDTVVQESPQLTGTIFGAWRVR